MIYLLPFVVTVVSVILQKTGILAGRPGSQICFIGELAALMISFQTWRHLFQTGFSGR